MGDSPAEVSAEDVQKLVIKVLSGKTVDELRTLTLKSVKRDLKDKGMDTKAHKELIKTELTKYMQSRTEDESPETGTSHEETDNEEPTGDEENDEENDNDYGSAGGEMEDEDLDDGIHLEEWRSLPASTRERVMEVVWVKYPYNNISFWPGLIYHPAQIKGKLLRPTHKHLSKKYLVHFYGSHDFGHILFANCHAFHENMEKYGNHDSNKKIKKVTLDIFKNAVQEATEEASLEDKWERASWLLKERKPRKASTPKPANPKPVSQKKKKKKPGRPKAAAAVVSDDEGKDTPKPVDEEIAEPESEEHSEVEEEEAVEEDVPEDEDSESEEDSPEDEFQDIVDNEDDGDEVEEEEEYDEKPPPKRQKKSKTGTKPNKRKRARGGRGDSADDSASVAEQMKNKKRHSLETVARFCKSLKFPEYASITPEDSHKQKKDSERVRKKRKNGDDKSPKERRKKGSADLEVKAAHKKQLQAMKSRSNEPFAKQLKLLREIAAAVGADPDDPHDVLSKLYSELQRGCSASDNIVDDKAVGKTLSRLYKFTMTTELITQAKKIGLVGAVKNLSKKGEGLVPKRAQTIFTRWKEVVKIESGTKVNSAAEQTSVKSKGPPVKETSSTAEPAQEPGKVKGPDKSSVKHEQAATGSTPNKVSVLPTPNKMDKSLVKDEQAAAGQTPSGSVAGATISEKLRTKGRKAITDKVPSIPTKIAEELEKELNSAAKGDKNRYRELMQLLIFSTLLNKNDKTEKNEETETAMEVAAGTLSPHSLLQRISSS